MAQIWSGLDFDLDVPGRLRFFLAVERKYDGSEVWKAYFWAHERVSALASDGRFDCTPGELWIKLATSSHVWIERSQAAREILNPTKQEGIHRADPCHPTDLSHTPRQLIPFPQENCPVDWSFRTWWGRKGGKLKVFTDSFLDPKISFSYLKAIILRPL